jgi:hypothetical protein
MDRMTRPERRGVPWRWAVPILLVLSACSGPDPAVALERVHAAGRTLASSLAQAVSAVHDAQTGYASVEFAARAVGNADAAIERFAAAARDVSGDAAVNQVTVGMETSARSVVSALRRNDPDSAEEIRAREFTAIATRLGEVASVAAAGSGAGEAGAGGSGGYWPMAGAAIALMAVAGAVIARHAEHSQREERRQAAERLPSAGGVVPAAGGPSPSPGVSATEADLPRTARSRSMTVDLGAVLSSAVGQAAGRGWNVTLICPDHVRVAVDPLRLQRVLTGFLAASFLKGAEHAGIVVDAREDLAMVSIGDDGPLGSWEGEGRPPEVAHQLERAEKALTGSNVTVGWVSAEGVSMYILRLERQEAEAAEVAALGEPQVSA